MAGESSFQLLVRVEPNPYESGASALYRTVRANGFDLRGVLEHLGVTSLDALAVHHMKSLSWLTGIAPRWLEATLFLEPVGRNRRQCRFVDQPFTRAASPKGFSARICPVCVSIHEHCKVSWILRSAAVCHIHRCYLQEQCSSCNRTISWSRPAMDICGCGRYLTSHVEGTVDSESVLSWAAWVEVQCVRSVGGDAMSWPTVSLPSILNGMTIDGAYRLIEAFGLFKSPVSAPGRGLTNRVKPFDVAQIIERGIDRLLCVESDLKALRHLAPLIHMPAIERLKDDSTHVGDQACAQVLLELLRTCKSGPIGKGNYVRGQMSLFGLN